MKRITLILVILLFQGCSNSINFIKENSIKKTIPDDIKQKLQLKNNQSLLIFTSLYFNDSIKVSQKKHIKLLSKINTDEIIGVAKLVGVEPENTIVEFINRNYKFFIKKEDISKYNYIYISCYPKIDTATSIDGRDMLKANYVIELSNTLRYFK